MPGPTISERELRSRVRALIDQGALPVLRVSNLDAGYGHDHTCWVCAEQIAASQIEYEVSADRHPRMSFHIKCFSIWQLECAQRIESTGSSAPSTGGTGKRGTPDSPDGEGYNAVQGLYHTIPRPRAHPGCPSR